MARRARHRRVDRAARYSSSSSTRSRPLTTPSSARRPAPSRRFAAARSSSSRSPSEPAPPRCSSGMSPRRRARRPRGSSTPSTRSPSAAIGIMRPAAAAEASVRFRTSSGCSRWVSALAGVPDPSVLFLADRRGGVLAGRGADARRNRPPPSRCRLGADGGRKALIGTGHRSRACAAGRRARTAGGPARRPRRVRLGRRWRPHHRTGPTSRRAATHRR